MTLQQIKYFIEVAQEKSFSQAADNLFVAQSGLSRAISNLEQELGVSLFVRGGNKKIFLTSYGESFLEYAKSAVETLDRAVAAIDKMRAPSALWGEVRLGYAYLTGCDVVSNIFEDLYKEESAKNITMHFDIRHDDGVSLADQMLAGEYDLVLTGREHYDDEGLQSQVIADQKMYVLVPPNSPLALEKKISFDDIRSLPVVSPSATSSLSAYIRKLYESHGCKPNCICHLSSWTQRVLYVSLGKGITIIPPVSFKKSVAVELDDPTDTRPVYITYPSPQYRKLSPAAEYVRDFCIRRYDSLRQKAE